MAGPELAKSRPIAPARIRTIILEQSKRANVGHIGSALSIADIVAALYGRVFLTLDPDDPNRDRFVISKGHAVLAVYAALFLKGWLTEGQLNTFCADESLLGVHPERALRGIDFSTGSLGQGLSIAAGAALAARMQGAPLRREKAGRQFGAPLRREKAGRQFGAPRRAFALVSDAECNEGALWEAVMFAAHHRLANLVAIVDLNGQQALGYTKDVLSLAPMDERWRAFGWDAHVVDGHDVEGMARTIEALNTNEGPPHVLIARTVFGHGVSFMESQIKWHYMPMSDAEYSRALQEVSQA